MAAGLGFKTFTTGEVLTAADTNGYLMQGVLVFASAAARDAAITSPQEGQCCYLKDTDAVLTYSGSAWVGFDDSNAIQNSIVDAKGDIVAASAADTPARLAVGANGETLVADSSTSTGLRYTAGNPIPNPVINSCFDIWQRGTSISGAGVYPYTADRWTAVRAGYAAGSTISRQATNDTTNLPNVQYCARVQRDSGNTSTAYIEIASTFESANSIPFAGKTVTFSFYARKGANYSEANSIVAASLVSGTGTDQFYTNFTSATAVATTNASLTTTWQRFTVTGTMSSAAKQLDVSFTYTPQGTAGAADYFEVTGVQVDIGSVALPVRRTGTTIQGELAACQRYYARFGGGGGYDTFGIGSAGSTGAVGAYFKLPVTMRTTPTAIDYSTLGAYDGISIIGTPDSVTLVGNESGRDNAKIAFNKTSAFTQYRPYFIFTNNSSSGYLGFTAEL